MGFYVNPTDGTSKEEWLAKNGELYSGKLNWCDQSVLPVCLVKNPGFTAAGIVYDKHEYNAFADINDHRPKTWYSVPLDKLKQFMGGEGKFDEFWTWSEGNGWMPS